MARTEEEAAAVDVPGLLRLPSGVIDFLRLSRDPDYNMEYLSRRFRLPPDDAAAIADHFAVYVPPPAAVAAAAAAAAGLAAVAADDEKHAEWRPRKP